MLSTRAFWSTTALLFALLAAGAGVRHWWLNRPHPAYLTVTITNPGPTALQPDARPEPVRIVFSGAAAPLERIEHDVTTDFTVTPPVAGTWHWASDTELTFTPADAWPVGQVYALQLGPAFLAPQAQLENTRLEFRAPPITATVTNSEFWEDPTDPKNKRAAVTIQFSHPVDKAGLEKRLTLRQRVDPQTDFNPRTAHTVGFKLTFDETSAKAFVQSEVIPLPAKPGAVQLTMEKGVQAAAGGVGTEAEVLAEVAVPGAETYFQISSAEASVVTNDAHRMERVVTLASTAPMRTDDLRSRVHVWELPSEKPAIGDEAADPDHEWTDPAEIVPEVLAAARRLEVTWLPSVPEFAREQSFRFAATGGRSLFVRIEPGVKSFGDFVLHDPFTSVLAVEEFPRTVEIMHEGSVLALTGAKKLSVMARNLKALDIELRRLLPGSVAHLASQTSGDFQKPDYRGVIDADNLADILRERRPLAPVAAGEAQYEAIDFGAALGHGGPPRGLFELAVYGFDPATQKRVEDVEDRRIIVVTDLGFLVKDASDGTRDVFVVSLGSGMPVADAEVQLLGRNGVPVIARRTDADGRAQLPNTQGMDRERTPTAYVVTKGDDLAFMPFNRRDRRLDLSRFDVGGLEDDEDLQQLQAHLFSDRGIYRPGETVTIGMIVKTLNWTPLPEGLPLELVVLDPRGVEVRTESLPLPREGFRDFHFPTLEQGLTGPYAVQLHIVRDGERKGMLGQTTVRVEEFLPDRMTIDAQLMTPAAPGWIAPGGLRARVALKNLFGTPAAGRRVRGTLRLSPVVPSFSAWKEWSFSDPLTARQSFDETLADGTTNEQGEVEFPLGLERFERATYRVKFVAEGFEAEGNRSVSADAGTLVSPLPYLVAWKADGDLSFVRQNAARHVDVLAIGPALTPVPAADVTVDLIEITYVNVLVKQDSGLLSYQSTKKETTLHTQPLALGTTPARLTVPSEKPGQFVYVFHDTAGTELNRVSFEVVGEGNVAGRVDREAELKVRLGKTDYAPGDDLEVAIVAPFAGTGLITIERDHVYAAQWFKADGNATVQHIRLPEALEGNGYVVVSFVRDVNGRDIFMPPLASGVAPFSVSRARRVQAVQLDVPERVVPGVPLHVGWKTAAPTQLVLFAVDEGIQQVARWKTPDPLSHFFRKRSLAVRTSQVLDLLLPEYDVVRALAAPGGDEDLLLAGNINPFKRKGQPAVAFWSGVREVPAGDGSLDVPVPDYFNGTLRVVAVAVNAGTIGVAERKAVVRGPFVIQPTLPYFVAPGDEFDATALVANTAEGSGPSTAVTVGIDPGSAFEVLGEREQVLTIPEGRDVTARWRLRAVGHPGEQHCAISARAGALAARNTVSLSVRPAAAEQTTVATQVAAQGGSQTLKVERALFPERRLVIAAASTSPLGLMPGLVRYLTEYPHGCSEQVVSAALPGIVLAARPDLGVPADRAAQLFDKARVTLQTRQNADGAFGSYAADADVDPFVTAYATHVLMEARARGHMVPESMLRRAFEFLGKNVESAEGELWELRAKAYALYLLTRNGQVKTDEARALRDALVTDGEVPNDVAAVLLAATFQQLHLDADAEKLLANVSFESDLEPDYAHYDDPLVQRSLTLYVLAKHFPARARALPPGALLSLSTSVTAGQFNTLSAALTILSLDAWAQVVPPPGAAAIEVTALDAKGAATRLETTGTTVLRAVVPEGVAQVRFKAPSGTPLFYQLAQSGFDREPPTTRAANGLEVVREFRTAAGAVPTTLSVTTPLEVVLRVRSTDGTEREAVVVDLLPGGFEIDQSAEALANRQSLGGGTDAWAPKYADVREDRVVLVGQVGETAQRFVYRIKPTNRGHVRIPPVLIEGFYDRGAWGRDLGGELTVGD